MLAATKMRAARMTEEASSMLRVLVRGAGELPSNGVISPWGTRSEWDERGARGGISGTCSGMKCSQKISIMFPLQLSFECRLPQHTHTLPFCYILPHSSAISLSLQPSLVYQRGMERTATRLFVAYRKFVVKCRNREGYASSLFVYLVVAVVVMTRLTAIPLAGSSLDRKSFQN